MTPPIHPVFAKNRRFLALDMGAQTLFRAVYTLRGATVLEALEGKSLDQTLVLHFAHIGLVGDEALEQVRSFRAKTHALGLAETDDTGRVLTVPMLDTDKARRKSPTRAADAPPPMTNKQRQAEYNGRLDWLQAREAELRETLHQLNSASVQSPRVGRYAPALREEIARLEALLAGETLGPIPPSTPTPTPPSARSVTPMSVTHERNNPRNSDATGASQSDGNGRHVTVTGSRRSSEGESGSLSPFFPEEISQNQGEGIRNPDARELLRPVTASVTAQTPAAPVLAETPVVPAPAPLQLDPPVKSLTDGDLAARAVEILVGESQGVIGAEFGHGEKQTLAAVMKRERIELADVRVLCRTAAAVGLSVIWPWKKAAAVDGGFLLAPDRTGRHLVEGVKRARELERGLLGRGKNEVNPEHLGSGTAAQARAPTPEPPRAAPSPSVMRTSASLPEQLAAVRAMIGTFPPRAKAAG